MISHVDEASRGRFLAACELDPILGAQVRTDYLVRGPAGTGSPSGGETGFWIAVDNRGRDTAAISLVDGRMTVSAADTPDGVDIPELTAFTSAVGGLGQLTAPAGICRRVGLSGHQFTLPSMVYPGGPFGVDYRRVATGLPLEALYNAIIAGFPGYSDVRERWYVSTSHLFRHGLGFAAGIYEDGGIAATAGVYAMSQRMGVIACVATLPPYRGRGYAGTLVRYLCDRLIAMGKVPALQCAEESLADYYGDMGFRVCGRWGRILVGK